LVGVPQPALCEPIAKVLQTLGARRGMVVCGCVGKDNCFLDELSTLGQTTLAEFYQDLGFATSLFGVHDLPLQSATLDDLQGGNSKANAEIIRQILSAKDRGPKRDAVLLNSAAALLVAGKAKSISQGWDQAATVIDSGNAEQKLNELIRVSAAS
jgi:anthranilate phosphoribosyltransferase